MAEPNRIFGPDASSGERYPEHMMRLVESRKDHAVSAIEPDPLLEFASETPAADVADDAASVRSLSADAAPAECARDLGTERTRRFRPKQGFGVAAAIAVVAIWGGTGESVLAPVAAIPMVSPEPRQAVPSGARPPAARPLATEGQIVVISDPPGARVIVNGIGWGDSPLTLRYLPLGDQRVLVRRPGYVSQERSVRLEPERSSATVRVTLRPQQPADGRSRR